MYYCNVKKRAMILSHICERVQGERYEGLSILYSAPLFLDRVFYFSYVSIWCMLPAQGYLATRYCNCYLKIGI